MDEVVGFIAVVVLTAVLFFFAMALVNLVFIGALVLAVFMLPFFIAGVRHALSEEDDER